MSSGRCWSSEVYNPVPGVLDGVPSSNNYKGGFGTALMTKVGIFVELNVYVNIIKFWQVLFYCCSVELLLTSLVTISNVEIFCLL